MNYYRINEYKGIIPEQRAFPANDGVMYHFNGYPDAITDRNLVDLDGLSSIQPNKLDKLRLFPDSALKGWFEAATSRTRILGEPEFIGCHGAMVSYIMFTEDNTMVGIQTRYFSYLRSHYRGCKFFVDEKDHRAFIVVKVNNTIVGFVAPIYCADTTRFYVEQAYRS